MIYFITERSAHTLIYVVLIATCNRTVTELIDCLCCLRWNYSSCHLQPP